MERIEKQGRNIEYSRIVVRGKSTGKSKVICEKCGKIKRIKNMARYKGKIYCSSCKPHLI